MAKNLITLIQASNGAGSAGQTFRNNVTAAGNGVSMASYLVTDVAITGYPVEGVNYSGDHTFTITFTPTRGANAHHVQRLDSGCVTYYLVKMSGSGGTPSYEITSWTTGGSPNGAYLTANMRVLAPLNANALVVSGATSYAFGVTNPLGVYAYGDPWSGTWYATTSASSPGNSILTLDMEYNPSKAGFSPVLWSYGKAGTSPGYDGSYVINCTNRVPSISDLEFRWWSDSTDASNDDINAATYLGTGSQLGWVSYGANYAEPTVNGTPVTTVYFRWRLTGQGFWNGPVGPISRNSDPRLDQ